MWRRICGRRLNSWHSETPARAVLFSDDASALQARRSLPIHSPAHHYCETHNASHSVTTAATREDWPRSARLTQRGRPFAPATHREIMTPTVAEYRTDDECDRMLRARDGGRWPQGLGPPSSTRSGRLSVGLVARTIGVDAQRCNADFIVDICRRRSHIIMYHFCIFAKSFRENL